MENRIKPTNENFEIQTDIDPRMPIKPKAVEPWPGTKEFDSVENWDRILEKLSISVPAVKLPPRTGLSSYVGQQVTLRLKDGSMVSGFLQQVRWDMLHILNYVEQGKDYRITKPWGAVGIDQVARVYPGSLQIPGTERTATTS